MKRYLFLLFLPLLLAGCTTSSPASKPLPTDTQLSETSAAFDDFLDELFYSEVTANTINLHFTLASPENYGILDTPITLGDLSEASLSKANASLENAFFALNSFDYSSLNSKQQLTYDILKEYLRNELSATKLSIYDEILRPSTGIQAQLPVLYEEYKFYNQEDVEDYLELIGLTKDYFSQIIALEQKKAAAGLFMSDFACDTIISQCNDFVSNTKDHYLIETFRNKIQQLEELTEEQKKTYCQQNELLVTETILPAYQSLVKALEALRGSGTNDMGLCYFPEGRDYYEYLVSHNTGSSRNVEELEAAIEAQRTYNLSESTALAKDSPTLWQECQNILLPDTDSMDTLSILENQMLKHFPSAPETKYTVSYIDECMAEYMAPAFYITAPIDDYQRNAIFINANTDTTTMQYFTTLAHEGFPGHLYQTVMSYEAGMPPVRSVLNFPGYVEGWATYVEMMSYQYAGLNENVATFLSLNQSALLSLYASTDIGIHYNGWSFDDMLLFWSDYGISNEEALRQVYELIVEEPSHYLKYYVGYLEFLDLKETARETYGSNYSDVAFHQAVLDIGPAPFAIVEKYLDDYYVPAD